MSFPFRAGWDGTCIALRSIRALACYSMVVSESEQERGGFGQMQLSVYCLANISLRVASDQVVIEFFTPGSRENALECDLESGCLSPVIVSIAVGID